MRLSAERISKKYPRQLAEANFFLAVSDTDIELSEGNIVTILGRSGSGKTTLLSMLAGLLEPSGGRVLVDGCDIYAMDDEELSRFRNEHIGVIPQNQAGLEALSVYENIMLPFALYRSGEPDDDVRMRAEKLMSRLDISHLRDVSAKQLSGGELRRLSIARSLIMKPDIILADEPTGDLDDENTIEVLTLLREAADEGAGVVMVTHEDGAKEYADRVYRMQQGVLKKVSDT